MALETHIAGAEDRLIDGLHFGSKNTASYVVERREATFHPSSASAFQPSGVRLIRFNLADESGWLDGDTMRLCFTINNLSMGSHMTLVADSAISMFRRMRLIANGAATIEDVDDVGRLSQMFTLLKSSAVRYNDRISSWGAGVGVETLDAPVIADDIPQDSSREVVLQIPSGFLKCGKLIPCSLLPLTLELELDDAEAAVSSAGSTTWNITRAISLTRPDCRPCT